MAPLSKHPDSEFCKLLYIGDSSTGKTGSLLSLVQDDYNIGMLDLDAGVGSLKQQILHHCPEKIDHVDAESVRDKYKATTQGPKIDGVPTAFTKSLEYLTKWTDGTVPAEWGPKKILVIDSGSALGRAAFQWARYMSPTVKDPRQWYGAAQAGVEDVVAMITSAEFRTNVIFISHVQLSETQGVAKGHTNIVGRALGPILPRYFNNLILAESSGSGVNTRRVIRTLPTGLVELKTEVPFKLNADLPLSTGLSTVFKALKGE